MRNSFLSIIGTLLLIFSLTDQLQGASSKWAMYMSAILGGSSSPPSSSTLLLPEDIVYQGAFRLPGGDTPPLTFAYGGNSMTFNPDNNSLFITGHDRQAYGSLPDGSQVAEVSIPTPVAAANIGDLPQASFIQDFHNPLAGYYTELEEIPKIGIQYLNHPDTGPLLHIGWGQHLQPQNIASHGWFNSDLSSPNFKGTWFIGNQNLYSTTGYMFNIPATWADAHANSRYLATGRMRDGGQGGMGPALFAYKPWQNGGAAPVAGSRLSETTLLLYENTYNTENIERSMKDYQHADEWEGGAWISTQSGQSAVLFAGTKSNGTKYWYGFIHPDGPDQPCVDSYYNTEFTTCRMADDSPCPVSDMSGCCEDGVDCVSYRGWWSTHFDAQFILYNPEDLAKVAAGKMQPWEPQPYASIDIDDHLYLTPPPGETISIGSGNQRRYRIAASAYDNINNQLFVLEQFADEGKPVVHVWRIRR